MSELLKGYYKPTPVKWRKLGDTLLAVSAFTTTIALQFEWHLAAEIALAAGIAGKFLTNFFSENKNDSSN